MRALLLSDSHGDEDNLRALIRECWKRHPHYDAYLHCGDGAREFERLRAFLLANDPNAMIHGVRGNCDFAFDVPNDLVIGFGGTRIYLTHGHLLRVKQGLTLLDEAAESSGCTIAVYGHTHVQSTEIRRTLMINPGAACDGRLAALEVTDGRPRVFLEHFI